MNAQTYRDIPLFPVHDHTTEDLATGSWRTMRPLIDREKCSRCYVCWKFCPDVSVLIREEGDYPEIDYAHCKGCGICAHECPQDAITMEREIP